MQDNFLILKTCRINISQFVNPSFILLFSILPVISVLRIKITSVCVQA